MILCISAKMNSIMHHMASLKTSHNPKLAKNTFKCNASNCVGKMQTCVAVVFVDVLKTQMSFRWLIKGA